MKNNIKGYCSYCYTKTQHILIETHKGLYKNIYRCEKCNNKTVKCRFNKCNGMARGEIELTKRKKKQGNKIRKTTNYVKLHWNNLLCDEHNGRVASFENLNIKLKKLNDYENIFIRKRKNVKKIGSYVVFLVGGAVIGGPLGAKIAPELAVALGSYGALGTCMTTPTLISSLSGAALTSASVAAIGSAGVMIITAAGSALGAALGGAISNSYFGSVKDFKINLINSGKSKSVIFINGFLSQKKDTWDDWEKETNNIFSSYNKYGLTWESKNLHKIGKLIFSDVGGVVGKKRLDKWIRRATKFGGKALSKTMMIVNAALLLKNPWHSAMVKAQMTGVMLADAIARMPRNHKITLMGHSLGSRVIFYTLQALSTTSNRKIEDVILVGGAVSRTDKIGWGIATKAVNGKIYNFYSRKDKVLKYLYKIANAFHSDPIGLGPISLRSKKISNIDGSRQVNKHTEWKTKSKTILESKLK